MILELELAPMRHERRDHSTVVHGEDMDSGDETGANSNLIVGGESRGAAPMILGLDDQEVFRKMSLNAVLESNALNSLSNADFASHLRSFLKGKNNFLYIR